LQIREPLKISAAIFYGSVTVVTVVTVVLLPPI
jgi:hypothetical protein